MYSTILIPIKSGSFRRVLFLFGLFALSLLIKLPFLMKIKGDPIFQMPIIDSLEFDQWAYAISQGHWLWPELTNHTPLYAYFVAFIYLLVGYSPFAVAVTQYVLFSAATTLAYLIAEKIFNRFTAVVVWSFMTFYWFFIYVQTFIFSENLSIFLNLLLVAWLIFRKGETLGKYFVAGIILGLSVICRPEIFPFAVVLVFWLRSRLGTWKNILRPYAAFIVGIALIISPVVIRNYVLSGQWLLRTQLGANIYIGNNPDYKGTNARIEIGRQWEEFISMPCRIYQRNVTESESNRYFTKETLKIIAAHPFAWMKLIGAKIFSLWSGREFLRTEDVYVFNRYIVGTIFSLITTPLVFILAIAGIFFSLRPRKPVGLIGGFILAGMIIIFFPIKTRYLMTFFPFIILFSSFAINELFVHVRAKKLIDLFKAVALIVFLWVMFFWNPLGVTPPDESETFYAMAKNYAARGLPSQAADAFLITLQINSQNAAACNDFGVLLMEADNCVAAIPYFERSIKLDPSQRYPQLNREMCLKKAGGTPAQK